MDKSKKIFMDYQATTPMDQLVIDAMIPFFNEKFGNYHSKSNVFGWEAIEETEKAREQIAKVIKADPKEIIITSGATESNNLAIKGLCNFHKTKKKHIIISSIEHKCVINTARYVATTGFDVTTLPVQKNGIIDLKELKNSIRKDTLLVSIMSVNNEIGVIQPIKEIGAICKEAGIFFHTDAAQAFGKIPIDVNDMNIDLMSISAHKIYGPKGVGALYIRDKPKVRISPLFHGGRQEKSIRPGTIPVPLVIGFGIAAELMQKNMAEESKKLQSLFNKFCTRVENEISNTYLNGDRDTRYPGNINFSFAGVEGESLMGAISNIAVSSGSACTSDSLSPSYVLRAINIDPELAHTAIRFGIGRFTTEEEIDYVVDSLKVAVNKLREISPVWHKMQKKQNV